MSSEPREQRDTSRTEARIESEPAAFLAPSPGAGPERDAADTTGRRAEAKRLAGRELVRRQVASGSPVIRRMTAAERRRQAPRAAAPNQLRRRGR
jgi:hypothetical protein